MISQLGRGPAVALVIPRNWDPRKPGVIGRYCLPKASRQLSRGGSFEPDGPLHTTTSLQPPILSLNYLDQRALKDPGKDKHGVWRRGSPFKQS